MSWLLGFLKPMALPILKWVAIGGTVLAIVLGVRNAGRTAERVENYEDAWRAAERAKRANDRVLGADDVEFERLRRKWTRTPGER